MNYLFEFFNQGWVGSTIGIIGTLIGVVSLLYSYFSKKKASPSFQKESSRLIGHKNNELPGEIRVFYQEIPLSRLTRSTFIFWNDGNETLSKEDITSGDPIAISVANDERILSFQVTKLSRKINNIQVLRCDGVENSIILEFDFLDKNDGAVIEILHDGKELHPKVTGTVKGLKSGIADLGVARNYKPNENKERNPIIFLSKSKFPLYAMIAFGLILTSSTFFPNDFIKRINDAPILFIYNILGIDHSSQDVYSDTYFGIHKFKIASTFLGLLYLALPISILWSRRRKYPKELLQDD
jgi:hypothetical protein